MLLLPLSDLLERREDLASDRLTHLEQLLLSCPGSEQAEDSLFFVLAGDSWVSATPTEQEGGGEEEASSLMTTTDWVAGGGGGGGVAV